MVITVMITAYLFGYFISYLWLRAIVRSKRQEDWLMLEKIVVMTISILSWVSIIAMLFLITIGPLLKIDLDKKCKW